MSHIQDKALVVSLSISRWSATKQDKRVSAEIEQKHNARDAGRYSKFLIDKSYLQPITSIESTIRQYNYKLTLPWKDNGWRVLPNKLFMEFRNQIDTYKTQFDKAVDDFINVYDTKLINDARARLGTMYDPEDYPPGVDLRDKFGIDLDIEKIQIAQDFRVDLSESEVKRIQQDMTDRLRQREEAAMRDVWLRVRETVQTIYDRTSDDKSRIHDSLIDNAIELARLLPSLNIREDYRLKDITDEIVDNLLVNPWNLRKSKKARAQVAEAAQKILIKIPY